MFSEKQPQKQRPVSASPRLYGSHLERAFIPHGSPTNPGSIMSGPGHLRSFTPESKFTADPLEYNSTPPVDAHAYSMGSDVGFRAIDISKINERRHNWQRIDTFQTNTGLDGIDARHAVKQKERIVEVIKEVPGPEKVVVVEKIVEKPVEVIKEVIKEVPGPVRVVEIIKEVPGPERVVEVEKIVEKPVEVVRQVPGPERVVYVIKEVPGPERVLEVIKEVPGPERVMKVEVAKEVVKEVPGPAQVVEVIREVPRVQVMDDPCRLVAADVSMLTAELQSLQSLTELKLRAFQTTLDDKLALFMTNMTKLAGRQFSNMEETTSSYTVDIKKRVRSEMEVAEEGQYATRWFASPGKPCVEDSLLAENRRMEVLIGRHRGRTTARGASAHVAAARQYAEENS